jgi:RNA polymerase sigma factor (TIGR02999 family)
VKVQSEEEMRRKNGLLKISSRNSFRFFHCQRKMINVRSFRIKNYGVLVLKSNQDITRLLSEVRSGKEGANEALFSLLYNELHDHAIKYMRREKPGHTLQPTALVHEAYMQLEAEGNMDWGNRVHFLRTAARAMRQVLIQHARRKGADKRGGERGREPLDEAVISLEETAFDLIGLDNALNKLIAVDPRMAQMVELRFFGGLTIEETAKVLGISTRTVNDDWKTARAWLKYEIKKS